MAAPFQAIGRNNAAPFTLKVHRGEGMALLGMNWREGQPPADFVGFGIQYREPGGARFFDLNNRLGFPDAEGNVDPKKLSTMLSPIQKFRWVHFPRNAEIDGAFTYRVTPLFMDPQNALHPGEAQEAEIELRRETYPGQLNVAFTRGFVSSQAFVDRYQKDGDISTLLPPRADEGLTFEPTHPDTKEALAWMGFEARSAILEVLDQAIADEGAEVRAIAYDLNEPEIVSRLERLGPRLKVIIDNSKDHLPEGSAESQAASRLATSAGADHVHRQHLGSLQHNKTIIVDGPATKKAVCGSTNYSWRGFYVQANNAVIVTGASAIAPFVTAFDAYFASDKVAAFGEVSVATWTDLGLPGIDAKITFSPHSDDNAVLEEIGRDIETGTTASLLYSLAFLYETHGPIRDAITTITARDDIFVYGISDKKVGGIEVQKPDGNLAPVSPSALIKNIPPPFSQEPAAADGTRMHHKFVVIDFGLPTARVYFGSYNFSNPADRKNGENLVIARDPQIATSYTVEALRLFDHYHFRLVEAAAKEADKPLVLQRPPRDGETPWFAEDYTVARKIRDRELFA